MKSAPLKTSAKSHQLFVNHVVAMHHSHGSSFTYKTCQSLIILGKLLGLISWDLTHQNLYIPKRRFCSHAFSIAYKLIFGIAMMALRVRHLMLTSDHDEESKYAEFSIVVIYARSYVQIFFVVLVFVTCFLHEKRFWDMMKLFEGINDLLGKRVNIRNFLFKYIAFHSALSFITVILQLTAAAINPMRQAEATVYFCVTVVFLVTSFGYFVTMYFVLAANLCGQGFIELNDQLQEVLSLDTLISHRLHQIRLRYTQLYELASSIRDAFSWLITGALALNSAFLCLSAYVLLYRNYEGTIADYVVVVTLFVYVSTILYISSAADNISVMSRLSLDSLHNMQRENLSRSEEFQVILLINKLSACPVEISAAFGFFTVNMKTFTTVVSTILTYLIVLAQFRNPVKPDMPIYDSWGDHWAKNNYSATENASMSVI